jgi:uncharacterized coiled-coil DUF342 family protein
MALVAERDRWSEEARRLDEQLLEARGTADGLQGELQRTRAARQTLETEVDGLADRLAAAERERTDTTERQLAETGALRAEVQRLEAVLQAVFRSKTWKLHELLERLRGR